MKKLKFLIAAGGTGGHLFPAMAVLEQIAKLTDGNFEAEFVGNASRIEGRVVPAKGYKLHDLPISGLGSIFSLKTLLLPFKIWKSGSICDKIISTFKPDAVICAGAYISYPAGNSAAKAGIPLFLMESNVIPGKTIRMLSAKADLIFTAFEECDQHFPEPLLKKLRFTGNPVRQDILEDINKAEARAKFGLDPQKKTILVFGGSLGARSINTAVEKAISQADNDKIQFLWQTGKNYTLPSNLPNNVKAMQFIDDMASAYASADIVLARSGATTIAEICAIGKPSVLVPYPNAANNHQEFNALLLHKKGAALMINDSEIIEVFSDLVEEYLFDDSELMKMGEEAKLLGRPKAAEETANLILNALKNK